MENRSIREWQVQYARGDFNKNDGGELTENEVQVIRKELWLHYFN